MFRFLRLCLQTFFFFLYESLAVLLNRQRFHEKPIAKRHIGVFFFTHFGCGHWHPRVSSHKTSQFYNNKDSTRLPLLSFHEHTLCHDVKTVSRCTICPNDIDHSARTPPKILTLGKNILLGFQITNLYCQVNTTLHTRKLCMLRHWKFYLHCLQVP